MERKTKQLMSALVGPYNGKPILVICGGPSATVSLPLIPQDYPACVISANEHGFKQTRFDVDFIVSVDLTFAQTREPMETRLAKYGKPTINRWSSADYRIPEWTFNGDSGLTAVAVALMLGGHPVVAVGLDRSTGDRRYFWEKVAEPGWSTRRRQPNIMQIRTDTKRCVDFARDSHVRIFSGPMLAYWPAFDPKESFPEWTQHKAPQVSLTGEWYNIERNIFLHPADSVTGRVLLTLNEAKPHLLAKTISR